MDKKKHSLGFKILMIFLIILGITVISVGGWLFSVMGGLNQEHTTEEIVLGEGKKQALIIYQPSNNKTTTNVIMELAQQLEAQEYRVIINYPSKELTYDLDRFDLIAFGTPVYMGKISSQLKSYISNQSIENKSILLFATGMNLDQQEELKQMADWFDNSNQIDTLKVGKADPALMKWFLEQSRQNWEEHKDAGYIVIHDASESKLDVITGATMK
ncbi:Flavodoxin domain-containing protein [Anaerovirgula multivorans]|uniref:Flavodoxin domain-containing protein n=1 Tax=Anaerovirgula multivorans TaxID=312168 RepID=A0A239HV48_9FIRM|nr:flavodoxin domain-containing protein [Anaerovirgula multivorans]SNS84998.1 Flavodoxin domain-containing protein [Anaerovirgula multivorans]